MNAPAAACPACGAPGMAVFYEVPGVPVHSNLLIASREEALAQPRGDLRLALCGSCGFIANLAYDPGLQSYAEFYEESQAFSPRFRAFAEDLARGLVARHRLRGRRVLEIGCGKGDFLHLLAQEGVGEAIGIDPAWSPRSGAGDADGRIRFVRDLFDERYLDLAPDAIVCRHTLEHVGPVRDFLALVRRAAVREDVVVFVEVPDAGRILRERAFWDVYYEHSSYLAAGSLARLFRASGFTVTDLRAAYDDQYLLIEARPALTPAPLPLGGEDVDEAARLAEGFGREVGAEVKRWDRLVGRLRDEGRGVVLWGAGSKAVGLLCALANADHVRYVVDINPHKHGTFLPVTGQEIVAPERLRELQPGVVVAMNPIYREEIAAHLAHLGVAAELVTM